MLQIRCPEYHETVLAFARRRGLQEQLESLLSRLSSWADNDTPGRTRCTLAKDWAPYSYRFFIEVLSDKGRYEPRLHGGLVYFGKGDSGVGPPQLSVRIGDASEGWEIHT